MFSARSSAAARLRMVASLFSSRSARSMRSSAKSSWYGDRALPSIASALAIRLQRWQIRNPRHRHEIPRRGIIPKVRTTSGQVRPLARGDERSEGRIRQAVELARRHVARARRVIIHRVIDPIDHQQLARRIRRKNSSLLIPPCHVLGRRGEFVVPLGQNIAVLIEAIDLAHAFRVHQVRRVPAARSIENDVVRPFVRRSFALAAARAKPGQRKRCRESQPAPAAESSGNPAAIESCLSYS